MAGLQARWRPEAQVLRLRDGAALVAANENAPLPAARPQHVVPQVAAKRRETFAVERPQAVAVD